MSDDIKAMPLGNLKGPLEFQREVDRMLKGIKFESFTPKSSYFRPGTELPVIKVNMIFKGAGLGDYVCYMPAMIWTAYNTPWIHGRIHVGQFFCEFAQNIMDQTGNKNWKVIPLPENFKTEDQIVFEDGSLARGPGIQINGHKNHQLVNGTGGHLVSLGFMYYCNLFPPPEGFDFYPTINFDNWSDSLQNWNITAGKIFNNKYVVFTTGAVSAARTVPGHYWNPLIDHVKSLGLTPVFLGVRKLADLTVKFPDGCHYGEGIDLRDKTTMLEAAWIMKHSAAVIGLDNGLIQLAACTDANIVAAYNMVDPIERRPRRRAGKWREITLTEKELACTHCQSNMKNMFPHNFARCLYDDLRCVDLLFNNDGARFKTALDSILS